MWFFVLADNSVYWENQRVISECFIFRISVGDSFGHSSTSLLIAKFAIKNEEAERGFPVSGKTWMVFVVDLPVSLQIPPRHLGVDPLQVRLKSRQLSLCQSGIRGLQGLANLLAAMFYQGVVCRTSVSV